MEERALDALSLRDTRAERRQQFFLTVFLDHHVLVWSSIPVGNRLAPRGLVNELHDPRSVRLQRRRLFYLHSGPILHQSGEAVGSQP